jgi:Fe-S-cluster containining protein
MDELLEKWDIPAEIYELQLGKRADVIEKEINVNGVVFHIPYLTDKHLYVLWKCHWPDCHNCCEKQLKLPLVKEDIETLTRKLGYRSEAEFVTNETMISTINQRRHSGKLLTTLTMISLKRKKEETDQDADSVIACRFLNSSGCTLHPDKPSVCWIYPFVPSTVVENGRVVVHARFHFTGNCPGFYLDETVNDMLPLLEEYSKKIFEYSMAFGRTLRENYGCSSKMQIHPSF